MSEKKNCGHSIDLICGCVITQSNDEDRTVPNFLQSMSVFSAAGPFQIFDSGRDKEFPREEEPRVSLIYEEWSE